MKIGGKTTVSDAVMEDTREPSEGSCRMEPCSDCTTLRARVAELLSLNDDYDKELLSLRARVEELEGTIAELREGIGEAHNASIDAEAEAAALREENDGLRGAGHDILSGLATRDDGKIAGGIEKLRLFGILADTPSPTDEEHEEETCE